MVWEKATAYPHLLSIYPLSTVYPSLNDGTAHSTPDVNLRRAMLKFARMSDPPVTFSLPAQVILFTYGLLLIIIIAMYSESLRTDLMSGLWKSLSPTQSCRSPSNRTQKSRAPITAAGTAARLTAAQLTGGIRGRDDLRGKAVGTW